MSNNTLQKVKFDKNSLVRLLLACGLLFVVVKGIQYMSTDNQTNQTNQNNIYESFEDVSKQDIVSDNNQREKVQKCSKTTMENIKSEIQEKKKIESNNKSDNCSSCTSLLPVMDPLFNMREMCKQIILLEDHLFQKEKRCHDCICKHFLTIEALSEEAITLDKENKHKELHNIPSEVRSISKEYLNNKDKPDLACGQAGQRLRKLRKSLMTKVMDKF